MLQKFLAWYLGGSDGNLPPYSPSTISASHPEYDADVSNVIRNNGFHELRVDYAQMLLTEFVKPKTSTGLSSSIAAYSSSGTQVNGCIGVTSGAAF